MKTIRQNELEIPTKFRLGNVEHKVEFKEQIDKAQGRCSSDRSLIQITNKMLIDDKLIPYAKDKQLQTFYHELMHLLLFNTEQNQMSENEALVTALGNLLYEFELTRDKGPIIDSTPDKNTIINSNTSNTYKYTIQMDVEDIKKACEKLNETEILEIKHCLEGRINRIVNGNKNSNASE